MSETAAARKASCTALSCKQSPRLHDRAFQQPRRGDSSCSLRRNISHSRPTAAFAIELGAILRAHAFSPHLLYHHHVVLRHPSRALSAVRARRCCFRRSHGRQEWHQAKARVRADGIPTYSIPVVTQTPADRHLQRVSPHRILISAVSAVLIAVNRKLVKS